MEGSVRVNKTLSRASSHFIMTEVDKSRTVRVGNLPLNADKDDVENFMRFAGDIESVVMYK